MLFYSNSKITGERSITKTEKSRHFIWSNTCKEGNLKLRNKYSRKHWERMLFSRTSPCHHGRHVDLVKSDTSVMMKRAAANSAAICNIYKVEILSVQVKMLGHAALKKKQTKLSEPQHYRMGRKIYFKAYSIFCLEWKFVL